MIRQRSGLGDRAGEAARDAAARGAAESLGFGVTTVGDISKFAADTRPAVAASAIRAVSFGEVQAMAGRRGLLNERLAVASDLRWDGWADRNRLKVAVSPHAPYTVEPAGYRRCVTWSRRHGPAGLHAPGRDDRGGRLPRGARRSPAATVGEPARLGRRRAPLRRRPGRVRRLGRPARRPGGPGPRQPRRRRRPRPAGELARVGRLLPADAQVLRPPAAPDRGDAGPRDQRLRRQPTAGPARRT